MAADLYVGRSTVFGWKKKRSKIESWCAKTLCTESLKEKKTMKSANYEKVSEALF